MPGNRARPFFSPFLSPGLAVGSDSAITSPGFEPVRNHHGRFAAPRELLPSVAQNGAPPLDPYGRLAILFEDGLCRNMNGVGNLLDRDFNIGQQTGAKVKTCSCESSSGGGRQFARGAHALLRLPDLCGERSSGQFDEFP